MRPAPHLPSRAWIPLWGLLLAWLFVLPTVSYAIQSVFPTELVTGRQQLVTLTFEANEFDEGGNIVDFQFWSDTGQPLSSWVLVPQFVPEVTVFVNVPATAVGLGFVGHASCQDATLLQFPHTNPFASGCSWMAPTVIVVPTGTPPPAPDANIFTSVTPQRIPRDHTISVTVGMDGTPSISTYPSVRYQVNGAWTSQGVHYNWWDAYSPGDAACDSSLCTFDVTIPADADLGTAYFYNAYDGQGPNGPKLPITIANWPPITLSSVTPNSAQGGLSSLQVTLNGSGFTGGGAPSVIGQDWETYQSMVLSDTQVQATVPANALSMLGDVPFRLLSDLDNYITDPVNLTLVNAGGPIAGLAITSVAPDTAAIGQCVSMRATTSSPFASWGTSPFVAYSYAVAIGTEETPGPLVSETRTVALTADMFTPLADDSSTFQIDFDLCLPTNAIAGTGLVAPGGMLSGQPSAWVYPGAPFTIRSLWNAGVLAFDAITPSEITRGHSVDVTLTNADGSIGDGARALAQFTYTVNGTAKTRTVVASCDSDGGCRASIALPSNADLGPGTVHNPMTVATFPGIVAPFTVIDGLQILSITPSPIPVGSPDTTVTMTVSGYVDGLTDIWLYTPVEDAWYLIGFDTGTYEVIDAATITVIIPATFLASETTLTMELWNTDTTEYFDKDLPVATAIPAESASLSAGDLQQDGDYVIVPISWSSPVGGTIDCGTVPAQTSSADTAHCVYVAPGTYQVTARYGDSQTPDPLTVDIPSLHLTNGSLSAKVLSALVDTFTTYSWPVPVTVEASFARDLGIGIPDSLNLTTSEISVIADGVAPGSVSLTSPTDLTYRGTAHIGLAGTYTLTLTGETKNGQPVTLSATVTITQGSIVLTNEPLVQAGAAVSLPIAWPTLAAGFADRVVDCGTLNQTFTSDTGACTFTRPGTYTVRGRFTDPLGTFGVHTEPVTVTVPAIVGTPRLLASSAGGTTPIHDLSGTTPVATYGAPTIYPVPIQVALTMQPPTGGHVGVVDDLDLPQTHVFVKPIATLGDRTAAVSGTDQQLAVHDSGDGVTFQSSADLTVFPPKPGDPMRWQHRCILDGKTGTGLPVQQELYVEGPFGDPNLIQITTWQRIDPIYPYAPAVFRYTITGLKSGITNEPMTQSWVSSDGQSKNAISADGSFDALFRASGTKSVTLQANGPLSGMKPFVDQPAIPAMPEGAIAMVPTLPKYQRPCVVTPTNACTNSQYRVSANYPPLRPGERLVGSPTWTLTLAGDTEMITETTAGSFPYVFTAAGSYDVVAKQATTTRMLYGRTTLIVPENRPPTGAIDCSTSSIVKTTTPWKYTVSCKGLHLVDPDGLIRTMTWALPDLGVSKAGSTTWNTSLPTAQAVRVTLTLGDDSGANTVLETLVDLRLLH
jgi:hypothetical protein